ncbi:MAG: NmrA/HSCARG family protein [Ignavibacteriae bacterium]|nr:NmrA/HSCARG family protein [Ignavibacteriota bacterium]
MSDKKIIAVVGATGAQGGGLARAILNDKSSGFTVRAITRKPDSEKAQQLKSIGAEVVSADLDNLESMIKAFEGTYGAFCITNFWEHFSPEKEFEQAVNQANAAKHAGVKHVIWSTLDDTREHLPISDSRMPVLMGKYNVPHFDAKGEANKVFDELGVPVTHLNTVFYWDNFVYFGLGPKRGEDGKLAITFPMGTAKLPSIAVEDIGKCAYGVFKKGDKFIGKTIGIAGGHPSGEELASAFTEAMGQEVKYNSVPADIYRTFGFPGADEMGNMFQFKADFNDYYCKSRSIELAKELNPELQDFKTWLNKNKSMIPVE